ncbi:methylated-DNA--[protein]-cysteine S-methyltransferase [Sphingoaurantiacus capsulatus]|uniref:Methylated-DNA--protein-cysteine methyltransferase n=1 Tax=Sphingoaurantiacus capsulatus TaxID=1771310 RepID=A0ABV7XE28_9SPHN
MPAASLATPIGRITVVERDGQIASLSWRGGPQADRTPLLDEAITQLRAYFTRERRDFDLPLAPAATPEAQAARDAMIAIPWGTTASYGELAAKTGSSPRAFGQACGSNPLPIIVPCHRVIGSDGSFGFYSGGDGPRTKDWLLAHEGAALL